MALRTVPGQAEKAAAFRALHDRPRPFVIPNPWDAGSARMLARLGFEALATTSAGVAFALGRRDAEGAVGRDEALAGARSIAAATGLPVSADLEGGFGDAPETCAETIRLSAEAGLVGGSIEDATGRAEDPIYPFDLAVERIRAAARVARGLPFPYVLTARSENFLHGRPDLDDTIRRLQAFAEAGADVLYAPGAQKPDEIARIVEAVAPRPVNVVVEVAGNQPTVEALGRLGVRRISLGSSLACAAYGAFLRGAEEVREKGTFGYVNEAMPFARINDLLGQG